MKTKVRGCYPALITPFRERGSRDNHSINYKSLDKLLEFQINEGVQGVVIAGCTGAASVLTHDEQVELVKYVQKNFGKRIKVIAGDGSNSTREARELAKRMEKEAKVFLHLSISPYYNKPSDRGMLEHYIKIVNNIKGDLILYSVPGRTAGKGILVNVIERLAEHPRIIGIKEASGNIDRIKDEIKRTKDKDFFVISGDDNLTLDIIKAGGVGVISVAANVAPRLVSDMVYYALDKKYHIAEEMDKELSPLYSAIFPKDENANTSPNPVMTHYALNKMGFKVGIPRLPLTDGEENEKAVMDAVLKNLGIIN